MLNTILVIFLMEKWDVFEIVVVIHSFWNSKFVFGIHSAEIFLFLCMCLLAFDFSQNIQL